MRKKIAILLFAALYLLQAQPIYRVNTIDDNRNRYTVTFKNGVKKDYKDIGRVNDSLAFLVQECKVDTTKISQIYCITRNKTF